MLSGPEALDGLARPTISAPARTNILNAAFEPAQTPFDWLSRDSAMVDAFINDPLCFVQLQPGSAASFLAAAERLSDLREIRSDLSICLFSGSEDPVGQQPKAVIVLMERYRQTGIFDISADFYSGGRHEMLNEINRFEVRARLLGWLIDNLLEVCFLLPHSSLSERRRPPRALAPKRYPLNFGNQAALSDNQWG